MTPEQVFGTVEKQLVKLSEIHPFPYGSEAYTLLATAIYNARAAVRLIGSINTVQHFVKNPSRN